MNREQKPPLVTITVKPGRLHRWYRGLVAAVEDFLSVTLAGFWITGSGLATAPAIGRTGRRP